MRHGWRIHCSLAWKWMRLFDPPSAVIFLPCMPSGRFFYFILFYFILFIPLEKVDGISNTRRMEAKTTTYFFYWGGGVPTRKRRKRMGRKKWLAELNGRPYPHLPEAKSLRSFPVHKHFLPLLLSSGSSLILVHFFLPLPPPPPTFFTVDDRGSTPKMK